MKMEFFRCPDLVFVVKATNNWLQFARFLTVIMQFEVALQMLILVFSYIGYKTTEGRRFQVSLL